MCYTGTCPYESRSYGYDTCGQCMLKYGEPVPDDAECMIAERWYEEQRRKHPIKALVEDLKFRWWNLKLRMSGQSEIPF